MPVNVSGVNITSILLHRYPTQIDPTCGARTSNLVIGPIVEMDAILSQSLANNL